MKISTTYRSRLTATAAMLAFGAIIIGALSPAASKEVRPFLEALGIISCTSSGPCQEGKNAGTGAGLEGVSAKGKGVIGQTTFNSTSSSNGQAAVLGQDKSTRGSFNAGINGTSTNGDGVVGTTTHGLGVSGTASDGIGVEGVSSTSAGILGVSSISDAVRGVIGSGVASSFHAGVAGLDNSSSGSSNQGVFGDTTLGIGVQGVSLGSGTGILGSSATGFGIVAQTSSDSLSALVGLSGGVSSPGTLGAFAVYAETNSPGAAIIWGQDDNVSGNLLLLFNTATNAYFQVDPFGNLFITGQIYTSGSCSNGCIVNKSRSGHERTTYSTRGPTPSIEDFAEAQLINGQAYVRIDPAFASIMDRSSSYLVFITPQGPTQSSLYVTEKSLTGFVVRENQAGRSTVAFDYRIVAKPFASNEARLPIYHPGKMRSPKAPIRGLPTTIRVRD